MISQRVPILLAAAVGLLVQTTTARSQDRPGGTIARANAAYYGARSDSLHAADARQVPQPRRVTAMPAVAVRTVRPVSQQVTPPPPAAAPTPAPIDIEAVKRKSGKVKEDVEAAAAELARLEKQLLEDLAQPRPSVEAERLRTPARIRDLITYLDTMILLGEKVLQDEAQFAEAFARWKLASGEAASVLRVAADHFHAVGSKAEFDEERAQALDVADWYAARAARHDAISRNVKPSNLQTERRRFTRLVSLAKDFQSWLAQDPEGDETQQLDIEHHINAFNDAYAGLAEIVGSWTKKLDAEIEKDAHEKKANGRENKTEAHENQTDARENQTDAIRIKTDAPENDPAAGQPTRQARAVESPSVGRDRSVVIFASHVPGSLRPRPRPSSHSAAVPATADEPTPAKTSSRAPAAAGGGVLACLALVGLYRRRR